MPFARRSKNNKATSCAFCGCQKTEASLCRVKNGDRETEYICTDCLCEPETIAWMQAGGYVARAKGETP